MKDENYKMEKLKKVRRIARQHGLKGEIYISNRENKKYRYIKEDGESVHFGDSRYQDFLDHKDPIRRNKFKQRFERMKNNNKKRSIDIFESPAYLSYNILW